MTNNKYMQLTQERKDAIEKKIVEITVDMAEKGELDQYEMAKVANFVLDNMDKVTTEEEMHVFLRNLNARWPLFEQLKTLQQSQVKEHVEEGVEKQVLELTRAGKIDEAIALSKSVTSS